MNCPRRYYNLALPISVGAIALVVYLLTAESGVSLWDSPEFVAAATSLQIGHPPGAPFYLLLARAASLFAATPATIPWTINVLSALCSALAVAFLCDTIRRIAERVVPLPQPLSHPVASFPYTLLHGGAAVLGALLFAFTDTFWHSALESEVYALSTLFTILVFWSMLRWEETLRRSPLLASRWLLLVVYLLGLSLGVHLLALLTLPVLVLFYYFVRYPFRWRSFVLAVGVALGSLAFVLYALMPGVLGLLQGTSAIGRYLFGSSENLGALVGILSLFIVLVLAAVWTYRRGSPRWHTLVLGLALFLLGYSSYTLVVVRAEANPPLNLGAPADVTSLKAYLAREQYAKPPLYPRIYSQAPDHQQMYAFWADGVQAPPTFADNVRYTVAYQCNHQYWRYFLWNFVGRQDDVLNTTASRMHGNALSGISFLDALFLGDQSQLTPAMQHAVARQPLYALPLLFGILGILFLFFRSPRYHFLLLFWFLLTGIAIALYLNDTPLQPRERDYVYVGSFLVFSIPMGFAPFVLYFLGRKWFSVQWSLALSLLFTLPLPLLLLYRNLPAHNRHGRSFAQELAYNYLVGLPPQALLFTEGDNDTYPLWYLQQVEGFRTDVRVCNVGLLSLPWYREQLLRECYTSQPLVLPKSFSDSLSDKLLPAADVLWQLVKHAGKRPVYFTSVPRHYIPGIEEYLGFEGFVYRLVSYRTPVDSLGRVGAVTPDTLFRRLMSQANYTTIADTTLLADFPLRQTMRTIDLRGAFQRLAESLVTTGDPLRAREVLRKSLAVLKGSRFPMDEHSAEHVKLLYALGDSRTADSLCRSFLAEQKALLQYYQSQWSDGFYLANSSYYLRAQRLVARLERSAAEIYHNTQP